MKRLLSLLCTAVLCAFSLPAFAMDTAERLNMLEKALNEQAKIIEVQQKTINELKEQMKIEQVKMEQAKSLLQSKYIN